MMLEFYDEQLDIRTNNQWKMLGWVTVIFTLCLTFFLWYERFFERRLFLNRQILGDYIEENGLPTPYKFGGSWQFDIDGYEISIGSDNKWYVFKSSTLIMSSFCGDYYAKKEYKWIQNKLLEKVSELV